MYTQTLFSLVAAASTVLAAPSPRPRVNRADPKCPIVFDGRVPLNTAPTFFDTSATNTIFNPDFVKGNDLKWSQILKFPNDSSRFDGSKFTAVEVTLSDKSIFQKQNGFRRAGLQFSKDAADGEGGKGVKTLHWSVKQDAARPLNLTHEYLNVWHEAADFSNNQIQFQAGSIIGKSNADKNNFKILDRNGNSLYSVAIDKKQWQNFALKLDYLKNQVTIYYSAGTAELKSVAGPKSVNLAGGGQFQLGILKKPTGSSDVVNTGYQSPNLNEGQIYGGFFLEDSADGCVSL
ncbi:glycoside hydrolase family 131 protein [Cucurbitaria berberidis CBS 394.84]|uniref:Glycoside hydrolase family 131 protein n=1 Tax=Cucurbitaria berberidis CBS 394.84 TaxID=1168544 RepID=A0A9P4GN65_9PLEO|nr:glycoside hydrolase family 131 protein [Cucurbitaria berberidis CBS 394.84]KAF1849538.1 glycoside hydrolase family 131 protein [Cucurbitaria berberidis CBS 394.84]